VTSFSKGLQKLAFW